MTAVQKAKLNQILEQFSALQVDEVERAMQDSWKPFIQTLSSEEDKVLAFELFYEWQNSRLDALLNYVKNLPERKQSEATA